MSNLAITGKVYVKSTATQEDVDRYVAKTLDLLRQKEEQFPYTATMLSEIDALWLVENIGVSDRDWCYDSIASMLASKYVYRFRLVEHQTLVLLTWE